MGRVQIGTMAVRTEASHKALRYYERLGVLAPARCENGYREYQEADVCVVDVVRSLGRLGIPVEQTRPFLDCLGAGHEHPDDCVASMAAYRMAIAQLSERIDALSSMRAELVARLEHAAARTDDDRADERPDSVSNYMSLPSDLAAPEDDGAADHLVGLEVPAITLTGTSGGRVALEELGSGRTVLYMLSGKPGVDLPDGWDAIPGARGCTPEACGFRDHYAELRAGGADAVFGLSSQSTGYQAELAQRLQLPFEMLSDPGLELADALRLPTLTADARRLYARLTLVVTDGRIEHAFYPIFPPDQHAAQVLAWLRENAGVAYDLRAAAASRDGGDCRRAPGSRARWAVQRADHARVCAARRRAVGLRARRDG